MKKIRASLVLIVTMLLGLGAVGFPHQNTLADSQRVRNPENRHWYQRVDTPMNWHPARDYCATLGGHLVTIESQSENNFVYNLASWSWLGATDETVEGQWEWVTGQPWTYSNWAPYEPNNGTWTGHDGPYENYLSFTPAYPSQWNDVIDEVGGIAFVCEWDKGIDITSINTHTFIATDTITAKAQLYDATPNVAVRWTVIGLEAANNITGFPTDEVHLTDASGTSTFTFTPSANQNLVNDRHTTWTIGSKIPNPPFSFDVIARVTIDGNEYESRLSQTSVGPLQQDETDRLRQEYYDYTTGGIILTVPPRSLITPSLGVGYNKGNYSVQLYNRLVRLYQETVAAYHGRIVYVYMPVNGKLYPFKATIPNNAPVIISSGYRNPQRNKDVGGAKNSIHMFGGALDLVPCMQQVKNKTTGVTSCSTPIKVWGVAVVNGKEVRKQIILDFHKTLYPALKAAASAADKKTMCEIGGTTVTCGSPTEDHVHVNWR